MEKIIWGLCYNTEKESVTMPGPKVEKASHLLTESCLDHGATHIEYKFVEQLRGNQQYWTMVMPAMRCLLGATDALMRGGPVRGLVRPIGEDRRRALVFQDFWHATEVARILIADEARWESQFTGSLAGTLSTREKMALPGSRLKVVWATGDATLERIATVDWTHRRAAMGSVNDFLDPVRALLGELEGEAGIIAIAELLNLVTFAA